MYNAGGSGEANALTDSPLYSTDPNWSPDGTKIVFAGSSMPTAMDVYVMNSDGSGLCQLTSNGETDYNPEWSPDGNQIAFDSIRDGITMFIDEC